MLKEDIKKLIVDGNTPIIQAMKVIDENTAKVALVVDSHDKLIGTVTDGDIRRGLIQNKSTNDTVQLIMNPNPTVFQYGESKELIDQLMKAKKIYQIPLVDPQGKIVDLILSEQLFDPEEKPNIVVLMAGGLGSRLGELTENCPKPMLNVGDKPILHGVIENLKAHGFNHFIISVNYKAEIIEEYFKDGSAYGVHISYIKEKQKMGTAGSLSLLKKENKYPFLVMNGDVLTKVDFTQFLSQHVQSNNLASMCVHKYESQIPFGVVHVSGDKIVSIEEKPIYDHLVSAGIYALDPEILSLIPENSFFDMPTLFRKIISLHPGRAGVFPVYEYWIDVGRKDDFNRAQKDYKKVF